MQVLIIPAYARDRYGLASTRYRVYPFLSRLAARGIETRIVQPTGHGVTEKWIYLLRLVSQAQRAQVIYLQKKLLPLWVWRILHAANPRIIFDFDDALFVANPGAPESLRDLSWVKPRLELTLRNACHIVAGNPYLASYAATFNSRVSILPTAVDTDEFTPRPRSTTQDVLVLGWVGSGEQHWPHLQLIREPLECLARRHAIRLKLVGTMASPRLRQLFAGAALPVEWLDWIDPDLLPEAIAGFDVGLMPLVDDAWTRGKCGFKALQYMAMGVPAVVSPVGVNTTIISDGVNGFTAANGDEWIEKLSLLAQDSNLRARLGAAGRATVLAEYSVNKISIQLEQLLEETASAR